MLQMNPDDLIRLKKTFDQQAIVVDTLRTTVQSAIDSTVWESPAAIEFRNVWTTEFTPMLNNLSGSLTRAALGVKNSHDKVVEANRSI